MVPNGFVDFGGTTLGVIDPILTSMTLSAPVTTLTASGQSVFVQATGTEPSGAFRDVTTLAHGTFWTSSNPRVATVDQNGMVTVQTRGRAIVTARNEGVVGSIEIVGLIPNDADEDGLPDEYEQANGLNPNDPSDAGQDIDGDGLTNLDELGLGTNVNVADTDGDGLGDGQEVNSSVIISLSDSRSRLTAANP